MLWQLFSSISVRPKTCSIVLDRLLHTRVRGREKGCCTNTSNAGRFVFPGCVNLTAFGTSIKR